METDLLKLGLTDEHLQKVDEGCGAQIIEFKGKFVEQGFNVQIWLLTQACYVWVGLNDYPSRLGSMSTAVKTRYDPLPLVSSLVGGGNDAEQQMAQRLVLRSGKQVFVSCNLPEDDMELSAYVERVILDRLRQENFLKKQ